MIFKTLDSGDFDISSGKLELIDGIQEVLQLIRSNLRTFQGEEPLNTSLGVPYFQQIMQKNTPIQISSAILKQVVLDTDGVKEVLDFQLTLDKSTRKASVTFTAITDGGKVTATESFP